MEEKIVNGWVVANDNHPFNPEKLMIIDETFSRTRTLAVKKFVEGSEKTWKWWKRNFNFKVVRCEMTIKIDQPLQ